MAGGRPPKPTSEHIQDGTYQRCRHDGRDDIKLATGSPIKPAGLEPHASWLWDNITENMHAEVLAKVDESQLIRMCHVWQLWRDVCAEIDGGDVNYKTFLKYLKLGEQFDKLASRFGMTPVDRVKLKVPSGSDDTPTDPVMRLIHGRN